MSCIDKETKKWRQDFRQSIEGKPFSEVIMIKRSPKSLFIGKKPLLVSPEMADKIVNLTENIINDELAKIPKEEMEAIEKAYCEIPYELRERIEKERRI